TRKSARGEARRRRHEASAKCSSGMVVKEGRSLQERMRLSINATDKRMMGPIVVQKYGGSSVADAARLEQVADRVAKTVASGKRVVVVVSAMGKTTDELLGLARTVHEAPPRRELDMLLSTGERISMALLAMALEKRGLEAISFTGSQSGILTND